VRVQSRVDPVLLVLDDIHWADSSSLAALRHLISELSDERVLVVGTYRDTDLDRSHPLAAALADFRRINNVTRIDLTGLSRDDVTAFMSRAAGHTLDDAGAALAVALHRETAGNPFFVGEVLRHLAESGAIVYRDGTWTSDMTLDEVGIPEGIREVVGRRLTALDETLEKLLCAASVLGHEFEVDVLSLVSGTDIDDVLDHLDSAVTANLAVESGIGTFRFAHALVRSTLLDELSTTRRARLHRKAAEVIEERHTDLDAVAPILAHHWSETADRDPSRAVSWVLRAGRRALYQAASDDALRWFERGLDLLDPDEPNLKQHADLLIGLAEAQLRTGLRDFDATAKRGVRIGLELGDPTIVADGLRVNGRAAFTRGFRRDAERMDLVRAGLALDLDETPLAHAALLVQLGQELLFAGDVEERLEVCLRAVELLSNRDLDVLARARIANQIPPTIPAAAAAAAGQMGQINALMEELAIEVASTGDTTSEFRLAFGRTFGAVLRSDLSDYVRWRQRVDALRPVVRDAMSQLNMSLLDVVCGQAFGDITAVELAADRILELATAQEDATGEQFHALSYCMALRERGTLESIVPLIEGLALDEADAQGASAAVRAFVMTTVGRHDDARELVERARPFDDVPDDTGLSLILSLFADATVGIGDANAAEELVPLLLQHQAQYESSALATGCFYFGSHEALLARLLAVTGRTDEVDAFFTAGIASSDDFGAVAWSARSRLDYAMFCSDEGRVDDAIRLANEAVDLSESTELVDTHTQASALSAYLTN
jgi:tetratricopeptide (TPR) repeat protein